MKRLITEPLLHFLIAGSLLFAVYAWLNPAGDDEPHVVRITTAEVDWLKETWSRQRSRQPDEQELRSLVAHHLKEKLLVQEAKALGLEMDDTVVRRRLAQKMEFLVNDTALLAELEEAALRELYEQNKGNYQTSERVSFNQIYFRNRADAFHGLDALKAHEAHELGDSSLLQRNFVLADKQTVTSVFGPDFSSVVFSLESGQWQEPVESAYGFHLVQINEHQPAGQRSFEEVRQDVLAEWQRIQQGKVKEQYFAGLLKKYDVVMDEDVATLLGPLNGVMP